MLPKGHKGRKAEAGPSGFAHIAENLGPLAGGRPNRGAMSIAAERTERARNTGSRLLTTEQAAEYLGVSARTVKQLMSRGQMPYVKIGRSTRLDPGDLDDFIARNRQKQRHQLRTLS
jgi:excisionase family DNA binding protein